MRNISYLPLMFCNFWKQKCINRHKIGQGCNTTLNMINHRMNNYTNTKLVRGAEPLKHDQPQSEQLYKYYDFTVQNIYNHLSIKSDSLAHNEMAADFPLLYWCIEQKWKFIKFSDVYSTELLVFLSDFSNDFQMVLTRWSSVFMKYFQRYKVNSVVFCFLW